MNTISTSGSDSGHCLSTHGGEVVFTPLGACPNSERQRTVRLCMNLETPTKCHFIVMGVRGECLDALNSEGYVIDVSSLRRTTADFSKGAKVSVYNQDCPMYRGMDRKVPVKVAEFEVSCGGRSDVEALVSLVRALMEKVSGVLAANPGVSDVVIDAVFKRPLPGVRSITRDEVLCGYGHRKYRSLGEDILTVFRKRDGDTWLSPDGIVDILVGGEGGFRVNYSAYERGALVQRVRRTLEWMLQCQKSTHYKESFASLDFEVARKGGEKGSGQRFVSYLVRFKSAGEGDSSAG